VLEEARHAGARLGDTPQAIEPHGVDGFTHRQVAQVWGVVGGLVEHVARLQGRMEGNHLGHIMGMQGSREDFPHHAGAGMKQRHQMGDGKATTRLLASWLAKIVVQCGGIRHRKTGAIDPKGAMAEPASFPERLVW
jgi:hypothetical protein